MIKSLWPNEINVASNEVAPVTILKEQATFLGQKTQNIVIAEVKPLTLPKGFISYVFYLVAPVLDNYRFELFRVLGRVVNLYPIDINAGTIGIKKKTINSEDELLKVLADILSHPKTMKIVESMLVQSGWSPKPENILRPF